MATPYDGKIGLIYWTGQSVRESSIEQLARTIHDQMPNVRSVFVKVADGADWQGKYDTKTALAIKGFADLPKWIEILNRFDLEFHAWVVLKGINVNGEANRVRETCNTNGVRSMLLDVESGPGYFSGGAPAARDLIQKIRAGISPDFHLGLNLDARGSHPKNIFVQEWLPHVQSLHPMVYHKDFGLKIDIALANAFQTLGTFGLPIIPMLQAYGGVAPSDITLGAKLAFETHLAKGVTIYRLGTMGLNEYAAVRAIATPPMPVAAVTTTSPDPDPTLGGQATITRPGQKGYSDAAYEPLPPDRDWKTFSDVHGWSVKYKPTSLSQDVYASYKPTLPKAGRYKIEVFIPHQNAEAHSALYFVIHYMTGARIEQKVSLDQSLYFNQWASLGVFDLDPTKPDSGQVNQVDFSEESPPRSIVFSAVRWRPYVEEPTPPPVPQPEPPTPTVDGCDAPIGTEAERRSDKLWPGEWNDATGYARWYGDSAGNGAYHTGADLNLNKPRFNLDRGAPVYAMAAGVVTWAAQWGNVWRNIIIVEHDPLPDGTRAYTRYAHVENIIVGVGDRVKRGQQIASVGMSGGPGANYHLHFDISLTDILKKKPGHWPGANKAEVLQHYVDPRAFIAKYRPK
jgi:murein DD-endopeptidase MepM/ murein hydrolase activator NlpD